MIYPHFVQLTEKEVIMDILLLRVVHKLLVCNHMTFCPNDGQLNDLHTIFLSI